MFVDVSIILYENRRYIESLLPSPWISSVSSACPHLPLEVRLSCVQVSLDIAALGDAANAHFLVPKKTSPSFAMRSVALRGSHCSCCLDLFPHTGIIPVASTSPTSLPSVFPGKSEGEGSDKPACSPLSFADEVPILSSRFLKHEATMSPTGRP